VRNGTCVTRPRKDILIVPAESIAASSNPSLLKKQSTICIKSEATADRKVGTAVQIDLEPHRNPEFFRRGRRDLGQAEADVGHGPDRDAAELHRRSGIEPERILGSSCETMTTVAPRLSRRERAASA